LKSEKITPNPRSGFGSILAIIIIIIQVPILEIKPHSTLE
jgi:hypothetical protein